MFDIASNPLSIKIRAETSIADPDYCKLTVSQKVHHGGPFFFYNPEKAVVPPLVERLFAWACVS